jgi:type IV pilus assembly protein PilV
MEGIQPIDRTAPPCRARGPRRPPVCARGFSLVEVLVSLVIVAVGMLGLAKVQALAYASTGTASLRSLAAIEASSLASSMRADRGYWSAPPANLTVTITKTAITSAVDANLNGVPSTTANTCLWSSNPGSCSAVQVAAFDLQQWSGFLASGLLPNPTATISCPTPAVATTPVGCTIQLSWTERNAAINAQGAAANAAAAAAGTTAMAAPTYTLYVEP